jgi:hypothetical protein
LKGIGCTPYSDGEREGRKPIKSSPEQAVLRKKLPTGDIIISLANAKKIESRTQEDGDFPFPPDYRYRYCKRELSGQNKENVRIW